MNALALWKSLQHSMLAAMAITLFGACSNGTKPAAVDAPPGGDASVQAEPTGSATTPPFQGTASSKPDDGGDVPNNGDASPISSDASPGVPSASSHDLEPGLINPMPTCIQIDRAQLRYVQPSGLDVGFRVLDCDGVALAPLEEANVRVINNETGKEFNASGEGGSASPVRSNVNIEIYSLLVLDLSNSSVDRQRLAGAHAFVKQVVDKAEAPTLRHHVGILGFGGTNQTELVQPFTQDATTLHQTLDALESETGQGTTDLYGAYQQGLDLLAAQGTPGAIVERFAILLTDGAREAGDAVNLRQKALLAKHQANATIFALAVEDAAYDPCSLEELAGVGGGVLTDDCEAGGCALGHACREFFSVAEVDQLSSAFELVSQRAIGLARSNYHVGVCTPVELDTASLTVEVTVESNGEAISDSVTLSYAPEGILEGDVNGCDEALIAQGPLSCTATGSGFQVCQLACQQMGCGTDFGVSCGECAEREYCDAQYQCAPACEGLECGASPATGQSCGTCDALSYCDSGQQCAPACEGLECGASPATGQSCGTCGGMTYCDAAHECAQACVDWSCGTDNGVNCGTCAAQLSCTDAHKCCTSFAELGLFDTPGLAWGVAVANGLAFVADQESGLRIIDVSDPSDPTELGFIDTPGTAFGVVVANDLAFVADYTALRIIDVSDPSDPIELGFIYTPVGARAVAVANGLAFVADHESGVRIIDVSDPSDPTELGFIHTISASYDVVVVDDLAFVADYDSGLSIIDVSDPSDPILLGIDFTPSKALGVAVVDDLAFVADYGSGLRIIDVSDPSDPTELGFVDTPGKAFWVAVVDDLAFVAEEGSGLRVIDVSDPTAPTEVGFVDMPGNAYSVAVANGVAFVANESSGLRAIDATISCE